MPLRRNLRSIIFVLSCCGVRNFVQSPQRPMWEVELSRPGHSLPIGDGLHRDE
jgi:hypothetical protein